MLTAASVILAASLIVIQNNNNADADENAKIETFVSDATIEDILAVSEDGYVGAAEKADLVSYLTEEEEDSSYSVAMVDHLVSSIYQKGTTYIEALPEEQQKAQDIEELEAYLWALSESHDTSDVADLIEDYVAQAKKVNMLGIE